MKYNFLNIAKLLLVILFLFPEFTKVIHTHNRQLECNGETCCTSREENGEKENGSEDCPICKFTKFYFEEPISIYEFSEENCVCEIIISYKSSIQKSYLLNSKLLRAPPIV